MTAIHDWLRCSNAACASAQRREEQLPGSEVCRVCGSSLRGLLPMEDHRLRRLMARLPSMGGSELMAQTLAELSIESCA